LEFQESIQAFSEEPLTRQILLDVLSDYKRPFDKISELTKQGMLIPVKRGIFIPGLKLKITGPDPFLIANIIYGPSYVSLESAFSYWGMIPEKVVGTVSVTTRQSKKYKTQAGRFEYIRMPLPYYAFGLRHVLLTEKQHVLIASPEKALCDKIIATSGIFLRSKKQTIEFLLEDLRINQSALTSMNISLLEEWIPNAPKSSSIQMLTTTLKSLNK
jgi:hypothetical protein